MLLCFFVVHPPSQQWTAKWRCFLSGCRTDFSPPSDWQSIFSRSALEYKHTSLDKPSAHGARGLHFFPSKTMAKHLGSVQFTARVWTHDIHQNENQEFLGGGEKDQCGVEVGDESYSSGCGEGSRWLPQSKNVVRWWRGDLKAWRVIGCQLTWPKPTRCLLV